MNIFVLNPLGVGDYSTFIDAIRCFDASWGFIFSARTVFIKMFLALEELKYL